MLLTGYISLKIYVLHVNIGEPKLIVRKPNLSNVQTYGVLILLRGWAARPSILGFITSATPSTKSYFEIDLSAEKVLRLVLGLGFLIVCGGGVILLLFLFGILAFWGGGLLLFGFFRFGFVLFCFKKESYCVILADQNLCRLGWSQTNSPPVSGSRMLE